MPMKKRKQFIESIDIYGAKVHNLKNINVSIPRNKLVIITGLSGSGKSSLAFDTVYAEGQRRYAESLSTYARQFLGLLDKPAVDKITGLSPTIAIDQRAMYNNPRSTVGTITEIYDYLRILYSKIGKPHCSNCGELMRMHSINDILKDINKLTHSGKVGILFKLGQKDGEKLICLLNNLNATEYKYLLGNNKKYSLEEIKEEVQKGVQFSNLYVYLEAIQRDPKTKCMQGIKIDYDKKNLVDLIKKGLDLSNGQILLIEEKNGNKHIYSENFYCEKCDKTLPKIEPRCFSFNSPYGACPKCKGMGTRLEINPELVLPNKNLTLNEGAIDPLNKIFPNQTSIWKKLKEMSHAKGFSLDMPLKMICEEHLKMILYGSDKEKDDFEFEGISKILLNRLEEAKTDYIKQEIRKYLKMTICPSCKGKRLKKDMLNIFFSGQPISSITEMSIEKGLKFFANLKKVKSEEKSKNDAEWKITNQIIKEVIIRLKNLSETGIGYLSLARSVTDLAGGEFQRVKLATQISSLLTGIIYILDEPSIGLHPKDTSRLINTLKELRDQGNTVIVVEHDRDTILAGDYVIDVGKGAGDYGGKIIAQGIPSEIMKNRESITAGYLSGALKITSLKKIRKNNGKYLVIKGAKEFNLKNLDVKIPLGNLVCVTGVSGSGKSTLVIDIIAKFLMKKFYRAKDDHGKFSQIEGVEHLNKVINIDQSPIGRTPRSNPATYTGLFTYIRDLYARLPESRMRGYKVGNFSFNVKEGRCEECAGEGMVKIQMLLLQDVYIECEECEGKRYCPESLEIHWHNKHIADVLNMTVKEAMLFFDQHSMPRDFKNRLKTAHDEQQSIIFNKLKTLDEVGLGYVKLGQPATTLSGGEAQRIKLAAELSKKSTGRTLYILDEPTTGLHFDDINRLLLLLNKLVDQGNTVLIIEHNLDVIKCADWVIDLGPLGGDQGGYIVAEGAPNDIIKVKESFTGKYLRNIMKDGCG